MKSHLQQHRRSRINRINATTSVPLRVATGGMLVTLMVGGGLAVTQKKDVDIDANGQQLHAVALTGTVSDVLAKAGVYPGPDDVVTPPLDTPVADGTDVKVRTVRTVAVTVDGVTKNIDTTALTVGELMGELGTITPQDEVSATADESIPTTGMDLAVTTPKTIHLVDGAQPVVDQTLTVTTVADALDKAGVMVSPTDTVTPPLIERVKDGDTITITRIVTTKHEEIGPFSVPAVTVDDPNLDEGTTKEVKPGKDGTRKVVRMVTTTNGQETGNDVVEDTVLVDAVPATIARGTKPKVPAAPAVAGHTKWDTLAFCESTNNWAINTGNGFSGGLQFTPSTWLAFGGGKYAPMAWQATREQQIDIAEKVLAVQGWGAWPACTRKLGWR